MAAIEARPQDADSQNRPPIAKGDLVITWYDDNPVQYGGPADGGPFTTLTFGVLDGRTPVRRCDPERVAPAGTPIPPRDDRVTVVNRPRSEMPYGQPGTWRLTLPGQPASWHRTKRAGTAVGLRRVAILDWHAAQADATATPPHEGGQTDYVTCPQCGTGDWDFTAPGRAQCASGHEWDQAPDPAFPGTFVRPGYPGDVNDPERYPDGYLDDEDCEGGEAEGEGEGETATAVAQRLTGLATSLGVSETDLDEYVHDLASSPASDINNSGLAGQVAYLIRQAGPAEAERMIREAAQQGSGRG